MKQRLLGTPIGTLAMRSRAMLDLYGSPLEDLAAMANDQLAEFLVTRLATRNFVDVGAHIGSITAAVRKHCPGVSITAVEAIPEKAARLRAKFPAVTVLPVALADYEGETSFFINQKRSGYSSFNPAAGEREIKVQVKRLDTLVSDPEIVKIDVEGAELGVLRGCENLVSRPIYMFESAPGEVLGNTKAALWQWFAERDYAIFLPNRLAHAAPPMVFETFLDAHQYPRRATNYFAVPTEKIETARARARRVLRLDAPKSMGLLQRLRAFFVPPGSCEICGSRAKGYECGICYSPAVSASVSAIRRIDVSESAAAYVGREHAMRADAGECPIVGRGDACDRRMDS
jgi:FkbM family methyltransferase